MSLPIRSTPFCKVYNSIRVHAFDEAPGKFASKEFKKETVSGLYTGMSSLFVNIARAVVTLFMGIYFSGGNEANAFLLTLIMPITAGIYVIGWICNKRLSIASQGCPAS